MLRSSRLGDAASAGHGNHGHEGRDHLGVGQREEQQAGRADEVEDEHDRRDEGRREAEQRRVEALLVGREGVLEDLIPVGLDGGGEEVSREHAGHRDGERVVAVVLLEHVLRDPLRVSGRGDGAAGGARRDDHAADRHGVDDATDAVRDGGDLEARQRRADLDRA